MRETHTSQKPSLAQKNAGKYLRKEEKTAGGFHLPYFLIPLGFVLIEAFAYGTLLGYDQQNLWPLAFGLLWGALLGALIRLLPGIWARIAFGISYFLYAIYAVVQTGYYMIFKEMLWLSDFRYASEGSDYFEVILTFPIAWWLSFAGLLILGAVIVWKFPVWKTGKLNAAIAAGIAAAAIAGTVFLPEAVFIHDKQIQYARGDYGRAQAAEAAYDNMFNCHRLYQVCGIFQTGIKDVYTNFIYPITPAYAKAQAEGIQQIDAYFENRGQRQENEMTGIFEGKNVVLVLMESMDDWAIGEHTPTINRLMAEGINFTNFYTPGYGGVRTFNSEFCMNTGSFLSSAGGFAFDYVTNHFDQSLPSLMRGQGYSAKVYHYNDPSFYSRGVFSPAMGYEEYVTYMDYTQEQKDLYDEEYLFNNEDICADFFREGQTMNFIITRSAHMSYRYNEVLSYYALKKYPQYRGLTGNEELDCMFVKARLVDDLFARLLAELEEHGQLENTVIVAMTDHYTYAMEDQQLVLDQSGVEDKLLVEKTPCFIWSAEGPSMQVTKTLNTSDLLPTVLNLMGIESPYSYIGQDAFDDRYQGYALFTNGSWISQGIAYNVSTKKLMVLDPNAPAVTDEFKTQMAETVAEFVRINNLILKTDYYKTK